MYVIRIADKPSDNVVLTSYTGTLILRDFIISLPVCSNLFSALFLC